MTDKRTQGVHQENRVLHFWFYDQNDEEYSDDVNEFMRGLFKSSEFPRGEIDR